MITDKWSSLFPNISGLGDFIKMVCFEINNVQTGETSSVLGLFDKIKVKDIDPTPIGNILIKNLNQVLYFRDSVDTAAIQIITSLINEVAGTFDGRDVSADGAWLDTLYTTIGLSDLTAAEVDQLENIGATTISATQWGYLGALDQALATSNSPSWVDATLTGDLTINGGDITVGTPAVTGESIITFLTNQETNTDTQLRIKGKGTGVGTWRLYDEDNLASLMGGAWSDVGYIWTWHSGGSPGVLDLQTGDNAETGSDVYIGSGCLDARQSILRISGFPTGESLAYGQHQIITGPKYQISSDTGEIDFADENLATTGNLTATGVVTISQTADDGTYTGIVTNDSGVLKYRTKAEILADIGASASTHLHDTQTLQHDAVNSDGGAFPFDTTGIVTHNQIVAAPDFTILGMSGSIISSTSAETSIEELDDSQVVEINTGFLAWTSGASAATYTITGSDEFQIDRSFDGYIRGKKYSWAAGIKTGALTTNACNWIYGKSDGTLDFTTTFAHATFEDNVVIFEVLYDGTNFEVVKENHVVEFQANVSLEIHDLINVLLDGTGADITRVLTGTGAAGGDREIKIVGADILHDHGLETTVPDSAGAGVTWNWYYTDGSGNWIRDALQTEAVMKWNNSGTATAIDAGKFGVWKMYVSKDDIESSAPNYFSVMSDAQYSNQNAAESAIVSGVPEATNELDELEVAQLGYIVVKNNAAGGYIINVLIEKKTLKSSTTGAGASNLASLISTNVTNFGGILSGTDTSVQIALDTLDDHLAEVNVIRDNIFINAIRTGIENALSIFKIRDGVIDVFTDETGIDAVNSLNESYNVAGDYYEPTIGYGSDVCTGGTASASSFFAGLPPASAFDDNETTKWYSDFVGETLPEWIKYDLGVGITKTAVKLRLKPYTDAGGGTLDGFTLHGSNNDADWDLLLTDNHADDGEWEDYTFANTTAYRYYRITVTSNHRVDEVAGIVEVELLESFYNNMTLISNSTEAEAEPSESRLLFLMEDVDAATVNTDILGYSSLDNRANWETITLVDVGDYDATRKIIAASKTLTDRNDQTMVYKIVTANNKHIKIHAVVHGWKPQ